MQVSFLAADLAKWDTLPDASGGQSAGVPEVLVLPFFSDERPLRGAAGLCDWRLCGRLSRMVEAGRLSGTFGETTLYPPVVQGRARLPFPRLVLFGLGPQERFDEPGARDAGRRIAEVVRRLGVARYALVPPGRSTGRLSARRALELYLEQAGAASPLSVDLVVIESAAGQKEAAEFARR